VSNIFKTNLGKTVVSAIDVELDGDIRIVNKADTEARIRLNPNIDDRLKADGYVATITALFGGHPLIEFSGRQDLHVTRLHLENLHLAIGLLLSGEN
jgi:hypothetical protein